MDITATEREELKALSKEVLGKSSLWQKFMSGVPELITQKKVEEVPGENGAEPTQKEVEIPLLCNGVKQYRVRYYTVTEIKELLLKFKKQRDEILENIKKQQEEQKAKKEQESLEKQVQAEAMGSAT